MSRKGDDAAGTGVCFGPEASWRILLFPFLLPFLVRLAAPAYFLFDSDGLTGAPFLFIFAGQFIGVFVNAGVGIVAAASAAGHSEAPQS
ncbi:hypothetical protein Herbaro_02655 [Herbaspirillum sp. WKF16]|jgi:hypothetical protein|uniref:hypothetical protein n=1 Tax=Herbaspirillum sp. WKF16 TaxID=3028312 RepID=UPI0023AA0C7F|nr:hypothetical protein [Herbaspirillum sp. WKF16]WDZ96704.1 hypothetical protein Herbaro_02655 [Herbaspirillum sp. WKF16]